MKKIYIVRHAKSSWESQGINDHERPLNQRGLNDAPVMAKQLAEEHGVPQKLISSTANRAFQTAKIFAEIFGFDGKDILSEKQLYHADIEDLLGAVNGADEKYDSICIFAHNPGITYFANLICEANIDNVATCGILVMHADVNHWYEIDASDIVLDAYLYPKKGI